MSNQFSNLLIELHGPLCTCVSTQEPSKNAYEIFLPSGYKPFTVRCKICKATLMVASGDLTADIVYKKPKRKKEPKKPKDPLADLVTSLLDNKTISEVEGLLAAVVSSAKEMRMDAPVETAPPKKTAAPKKTAPQSETPREPEPKKFRPAYMNCLNLESTE